MAAVSMLATACTSLRVVTHTVSPVEAHVPPGRYALDPAHWSINFDVDHLHYSRFVMRFNRAEAHLQWHAPGLDQSSVVAVIDPASLDTNVALLDRMVKGRDLLDVTHYPQIRFVSTGFTRTGNATGVLSGELTLHGQTRPVTLEVVFNGFAREPLTQRDKLGFAAQGRFSRAAFGLSAWYPAVGDEVQVRIQAEFARVVEVGATNANTDTDAGAEADLPGTASATVPSSAANLR
ncbi:YceI family protein [Paraburkholderia bonniea]|uniref:YceI family protein n=1 Tax=Paraburkholderia bonniea TaxID=2152891 RepID=UPI00157FE0AD|nr:YceI family protein [Paraburkholderia bonniea]